MVFAYLIFGCLVGLLLLFVMLWLILVCFVLLAWFYCFSNWLGLFALCCYCDSLFAMVYYFVLFSCLLIWLFGLDCGLCL